DIGGGHGWYSACLCRRHPGLTATVLDLPGSTAVGRELIAAAGLADRVLFRDGDAAADLGGGYDAVLCFNLVHHLGPGQIADLFRRARQALNPGGTFAVLDVFADHGRRGQAHADLLALFVYLSSGAQVHTPAELAGWFADAGFATPRKRGRLRTPALPPRSPSTRGSPRRGAGTPPPPGPPGRGVNLLPPPGPRRGRPGAPARGPPRPRRGAVHAGHRRAGP